MIMKKILVFLFMIMGICPTFGQGFLVDDCHVEVFLNQAGYFDVIENYKVNFTEQKHGVFRKITTKYKLQDEKGWTSNRVVSITKVATPGHAFTKTSPLQARLDGQVEIKVGDPDKLVTGPQEYTIKYRVKNAFLFNDSTVQFYWNVKSNEWQTAFKHIRFTIHLPEDLPLTKSDYFLYSGASGNTDPDTTIKLNFTKGILTGETKSNVVVPGIGNSLTILINMPTGSIKSPSALKMLWDRCGWILFLPLIGGLYFYVWTVFGKDKYILKVVHYFPPKDLDPAMVGYLINDQEDNSDLISLIPYWGAEGLISLQEIKKKAVIGKGDTLLKKLKDLPADARSYEKVLFDGLFSGKDEVLISSLKDSFYTKMNSARELLNKEAQKFYNRTSNFVRNLVAVGLVLMAILGLVMCLTYWNVLGGIIIVVFCVVLLFLNKIIKKRNESGDAAVSEVVGFKMFVKTAEEQKLRILLQDDPGYFEKSLGYALTFGLLKKWAGKFNTLDVKNPSWYNGGVGAFSANTFTNSFSSSISRIQSNMVSKPSSSSSSGGGSSGGGFGGGGGGSW